MASCVTALHYHVGGNLSRTTAASCIDEAHSALQEKIKKLVHRGTGGDLMALCGKVDGTSGHDQVTLTYVDERVTCTDCLLRMKVPLYGKLVSVPDDTPRMDIWEPAKKFDASGIVSPLSEDEIVRLRKLLAESLEMVDRRQQTKL